MTGPASASTFLPRCVRSACQAGQALRIPASCTWIDGHWPACYAPSAPHVGQGLGLCARQCVIARASAAYRAWCARLAVKYGLAGPAIIRKLERACRCWPTTRTCPSWCQQPRQRRSSWTAQASRACAWPGRACAALLAGTRRAPAGGCSAPLRCAAAEGVQGIRAVAAGPASACSACLRSRCSPTAARTCQRAAVCHNDMLW